MNIEFIEKLKSEFQPYQDIQYEMSPLPSQYYREIPPNPYVASVLACLYPHQDEWHMIYIKRIATDTRDKHAGQISFPGGKREASDIDDLDTALREAEEEVGIDKNKVEIIGKLSELYIPVSNFLVHPYLGYSTERPAFIRQVEEVDEIIEIPISLITRPNIKNKKDIIVGTRTLKNVPYFDLNGIVLWGATAMMTNEIVFNINKLSF